MLANSVILADLGDFWVPDIQLLVVYILVSHRMLTVVDATELQQEGSSLSSTQLLHSIMHMYIIQVRGCFMEVYFSAVQEEIDRYFRYCCMHHTCGMYLYGSLDTDVLY